MGKKGKKKAGRKDKVRLPKEVAGMKVPKGLRKQAETLIQFIDSPAGRELAATGLTLAAARISSSAKAGRGKGTALSALAGVGGARAAKDDPVQDLGEVLRAAVAEGARRFLAGFEEGGRTAPESGPDAGSDEDDEAEQPAE